MIYLMLDTCIWISFLSNVELFEPLRKLEGLIDDGIVTLLTTQEILNELDVDRRRPVRRTRTETNLLSEVVRRNFHSSKEEVRQAALVLSQLKNLVDREALVAEACVYVDDLLQRCVLVPGDEAIHTRVETRKLHGLAPFHGNKSSDKTHNDAMIIEKFASKARSIRGGDERFIFVSKNRDDFCVFDNPDVAHPHFDDIFENGRVEFTCATGKVFDLIDVAYNFDSNTRVNRFFERRSWKCINDEIREIEHIFWYQNYIKRKKAIENNEIELKPDRHISVVLRHNAYGIANWKADVRKAESLVRDTPGLPAELDSYKAGFAAGAVLALKWALGENGCPMQALVPGQVQANGDETKAA